MALYKDLKTKPYLGLYIGTNNGNDIKVGMSLCLQRRIFDPCYTTAHYNTWGFRFLISKKQDVNDAKDNANYEKIVHDYLENNLELERSGLGTEMFRIPPQNKLTFDIIVQKIEKLLEEKYDTLEQLFTNDNKLFKKFNTPFYKHNSEFEGPIYSSDKFTCCECNQKRERKSYFIVKLYNDKTVIIGGDCLDKIKKEYNLKNSNPTFEFYYNLEGYNDDDILTYTEQPSLNETCYRTIARLYNKPEGDVISRYTSVNISNYTLHIIRHVCMILLINYILKFSNEIDCINIEKIVKYYISLNIHITEGLLIDVINLTPDIFNKEDNKIKFIYINNVKQQNINIIRSINTGSSNKKIINNFESSYNRHKKYYTEKGKELDTHQEMLLKNLLSGSLDMILAYGGCGKTLLIKTIYNILKIIGIPVFITTISSCTIDDLRKSLYNTIYYDYNSIKENVRNISQFIVGENINEKCFLLIDECSFSSDPLLLNLLFEKFKNLIGIIFFGDINQVKPVRFGNIMYDVEYLNKFNIGCMTVSRRFDNNFEPLLNMFKTIEYISEPKNDNERKLPLRIINKKTVSIDEIRKKVKEINSHNIRLEKFTEQLILDCDGDKYIFIAETNETCDRVNSIIYEKIKNDNCPDCSNDLVINERFTFCNDCLRNFEFICCNNISKHHINNGERIFILSIDSTQDEDIINFRKKPYNTGDILQIPFEIASEKFKLGYCITVHKMQGQQAKNVCFILDKSQDKTRINNILYSGSSRMEENLLYIIYENITDEKTTQNNTDENNILQVGKHKGKSYKELSCNTSYDSYCYWVRTYVNPTGEILKFQNFLKNKK